MLEELKMKWKPNKKYCKILKLNNRLLKNYFDNLEIATQKD